MYTALYILILITSAAASLIYKPKLSTLNTITDLGWSFNNQTVYWGTTQPFSFTRKIAGTEAIGIWNAKNEFTAGEHGGTHFDAPYHFNEKGWKVGEIPLSRLVVNGITIDLTEETKVLKDNSVLHPAHLREWERKHGEIPPNTVVLINFGWSKYYTNRDTYLGIDEHGKYHFPGVSKEAAEWIAKSEKIVGVGLDTASVDPGNSTTYDAHRILAKHQIYNLESLKLPPIFPEKGYTLYVMPMKIEEGTGAPLRIIAQPKD